MSRTFTKPLNQMTNELYKYFWELRSRLRPGSECECNDIDESNEAYEMNDALLSDKKYCGKMNLLAENMLAELEKRDELDKEWKNGYKKCVSYLKWLSSKLDITSNDNRLDYDQLAELREQITKKSYEIETFVSSLQKITSYDFRYSNTEQGENYFLQCVEIPEITAIVSKKEEDKSILAAYNLMNKKILEFIKEFPEKVQPFESHDNLTEINIELITSEI